MNEKIARIRLEYGFSEVGMDLFEAGHIEASREYAKGEDPFKWPSELRKAAFKGMAYDFDDSAAFPTARAAMVPEGKRITEKFLEYREKILAYFGKHLFAEVGDDEENEEILEERRSKMKVITNAYDMDAKENMWEKKFGNPHKRTLTNIVMKLPDGTNFSMDKYRKAQEMGTKWMTTRSERMVELLNGLHLKGKKKYKNKKLMAKSYMLQEAEATSREAKIRWAREKGIRVINLQHDGIVLMLDPEKEKETTRALQETASEACGYKIRIKAKKL